MLNFHIHKKPVDLSKDGVIHLLQVFKVPLHLAQVSVYRGHLVPHLVLGKNLNCCKHFKYFPTRRFRKVRFIFAKILRLDLNVLFVL